MSGGPVLKYCDCYFAGIEFDAKNECTKQFEDYGYHVIDENNKFIIYNHDKTVSAVLDRNTSKVSVMSRREKSIVVFRLFVKLLGAQ